MAEIGKITSVTIGGVPFELEAETEFIPSGVVKDRSGGYRLCGTITLKMIGGPDFFGQDFACGYCAHELRAIERGFCARGLKCEFRKCGLARLEGNNNDV